ncbi:MULTISPECIES: iron-containing redox enzyme family protein [unclassified Pseudomonas]|uniref:TenA family transcriptional regulator n=1 Tax=unclassified Pseudomonas TaxID=196821 RepID=UPI000D38AE07|nr:MULTISPECIES: iron-containing redox enzyme family protein [unclassified Pseudomonas]RAU49685.1 iron-containing redox enzyme family protein [Pseudomonas sp. RIT 409]RAU55576.1 iron-containing redox enzyme family protein [Pseudomonas sp. RIT 412]
MNTLIQPLDTPIAHWNPSAHVLQDLAALKQALISQITSHPFLTGCRNGDVSLERLKGFLVQQGKYSRHFTRYICQLMVNLESSEDVLEVFDNLFEELGFGDVTEPPHSQIYRDMLQDFDLQLDAHPTHLATQRLIDSMMNFCKQPEAAYGLAALCLGAEAIVPAIYSDIVSGFVQQGIDRQRLRFFTLHIECDDGHADTLLAILARQVDQHPARSEVVRHAAFQMIQARLAFFDAL